MTSEKPRCDCLNDCGDDYKRIEDGAVEPCDHFKERAAEREARAAAERASTAAVRTLKARGYTYTDGAEQWRPPRGRPPAWKLRDTQAARDVLAERRRQVEVEGNSPEDDDRYIDHDLIRAAICYARSAGGFNSGNVPGQWPWMLEWWKPTTPRRDLVKAGALILAEIERIDRVGASNGDEQ
ncbi:hypothetical protein LMG28688_01564 [Paraburkholderia caffeinitolerans]|uniref:Uncharacterized protein n=1 Tax=Paraburkholderia caffeinitolerans TaxID=1723730 RepID=A0A6J5FMD0_9BURK|nr:hypothetical protein [Paraburkholderia caffeinitolerans]CAB3783030.1 hypothetical protein LMG28688_01564 [Paraburkholderia caffeinitolerans]